LPCGIAGFPDIETPVFIDESFPNLVGLYAETGIGIFAWWWIEISHS
jgi:hypothetical protein